MTESLGITYTRLLMYYLTSYKKFAMTPAIIRIVQAIITLPPTFIQPQTKAIKLPMPQTRVRTAEVIPKQKVTQVTGAVFQGFDDNMLESAKRPELKGEIADAQSKS